ncbi:transposase [Pseudomonas amygdali pv. eriobotryae]|nr:transposase [Pseudomonas amygdali pv. eriobotryae]
MSGCWADLRKAYSPYAYVESALRRWVSQLPQERGGVTPTSKALTPEQQKIQELEARINRLEREKSILKKATALLMAEEHERSR